MSGKLVLVGRVAGGFGVRGEVRIVAYTQDPLALARYGVLLREGGSPGLTLTSARAVKGGVIARAREVATKEAADALRGMALFVPRDALPPVEDDDDFYLADLIGLAATTVQGEALGVVKAVHNFGAGDILELDPGAGRSTVLVPFTKDAVPEVRLAEGRLIVTPPADDTDDETLEDQQRTPD